MQLSKSDALLLSKVLFHYEKLTRYDGDASDEFDGIYDIVDRMSEFLTGEPVESFGEGSSKDSSDPSGDDDASDDDDDGEEMPAAEQKISASELHELPTLEVEVADKVVGLEFEEVDSDGDSVVDLLLGDGVIEDVTLLRRNGKVIEIWADVHDEIWHESFEAKKLSKAWKVALKDGVVYEVT